MCSPPKHDRGVLARGYRANLSNSLSFPFFLSLFYFSSFVFVSFLFSFAFDVYAREREREMGNKRCRVMFGIRRLFRWRLCKWGNSWKGDAVFSVFAS